MSANRQSIHRLAIAGLIPFVLLAALVWLLYGNEGTHPFVTDALSKYAAVILSTLAGIHWGLAFKVSDKEPMNLAWPVALPSLAWIASLLPPHAGLVVDGVLLITSYAVDRRFYREHGMGDWLTLRFRLTAVASMSCFLAAGAT
ncbi:MAG: DUF3429 domain-containing protein [Burkholderiaceae bacterium]|nr:MAG: DUF3429 domain-containing protein [Burkholderiaceae bacterium]